MPADLTGSRDNSPDTARRLLLTLWLTISLTMLGLGWLAAILWYWAPPIQLDRAYLSQFTVWDQFNGGKIGYFYPYQSGKNIAFNGACLASPFVMGLSYFLARRMIGRIGSFSPLLHYQWGLVLSWLFFLACLFPLFYCPAPPYLSMPPCWLFFSWFFQSHPLITPARLCLVIMLEVLGVVFWRWPSTCKNLNIVLAVLVLGWAVVTPAHLYAPDELSENAPFAYHFNSIMDALSQVTNGHHWLVDFSHIYGGYIEILGPLLLLFPRRVETILLVFAGLNAVAIFGLLVTARLVIRQPFLFFLTGLSLLGIGYIMTMSDHYYQYSAVRMVFPSLGLLAATLYLRNPNRLRYGAVSLMAAVASIWNLDTGVVLWLSWTTMLMAIGMNIGAACKHFAMQTAILMTVWIGFLLYLRLVSGQWPDMGMLFSFQALVLGSGYFCLGVIFPDVWALVLTTYTIGLCAALVFYFQRNAIWKTHFILMLSLMGVGLFDYFMGRSAQSNLVSVSYPAILLIGVIWDETWLLIALGKLPKITWAYLLPVMLCFLWWAFLFTVALPELEARSSDILSKWVGGAKSPIESNVAFIKKWTTPHEKVYLLSNQSGFYYYLSNTVRSIKIPGTVELLRGSDMDKLIAAIDSEQFPKLFADQDFYDVGMYKPEIYQQIREAISRHYRASATNDTGRVTLYLPR